MGLSGQLDRRIGGAPAGLVGRAPVSGGILLTQFLRICAGGPSGISDGTVLSKQPAPRRTRGLLQSCEVGSEIVHVCWRQAFYASVLW